MTSLPEDLTVLMTGLSPEDFGKYACRVVLELNCLIQVAARRQDVHVILDNPPAWTGFPHDFGVEVYRKTHMLMSSHTNKGSTDDEEEKL